MSKTVAASTLDFLAPGTRNYTFACMASAILMAVPLMGRGMGATALMPTVIGLVLVFVRWRAGPVLIMLSLAWLVQLDRLGLGPFQFIQWLLEMLVSLFARLPYVVYRPNPAPKLLRPAPVLDVMLCSAVVVYLAAYCRLLGVTRNIFPVDWQRRGPSAGLKPNGEPKLGPVIEQKRSSRTIEGSEIASLASAAVGCAALAQILALWLSKRTARGDLTFLFERQIALNISDGVWQALLLLWIFAILLGVAAGLMSYLGHLRIGAEEAALYLQDQLWRETRREQARLNRWLAWAEKREARRRARRERGVR